MRNDSHVRIAAQALLYPVLALAKEPPYRSRVEFGQGGYFLTNKGIERAVERYIPSGGLGLDPLASPILEEDLSGVPPTLVVTAAFDPLRDEGLHYAERLTSAGCFVEHRCFGGAIHGFLSFAGALQIGREGLDFVSDWLRRTLS
jgi:acetyl esterase